MLIKVPQGWEIPERDATPERAYWSRREILAGAGLLGAVALAPAAPGKLYPAKRNPRFELDRPITEEWAATGFNNFYEFTTDKEKVKDLVGSFKTEPWSFEIKGMVNKPGKFDLDDVLKEFPLEERLYRFRCVEAWAMAVPWTGFPLAKLVEKVEPTAKAKWLRFESASRPGEMPGIRSQPWYPWPYFEMLRLDEATNPLTMMVTGIYGKPLPAQNGAPIRIITPWKYGYKSPKSIVKIEFTDKQPETFWHKLQPAEYGLYSNVNPKKPHPRWSQAEEKLIPEMKVVPTRMYNGYEESVAKMYKGNEF